MMMEVLMMEVVVMGVVVLGGRGINEMWLGLGLTFRKELVMCFVLERASLSSPLLTCTICEPRISEPKVNSYILFH